jgi:hypothetical protein
MTDDTIKAKNTLAGLPNELLVKVISFVDFSTRNMLNVSIVSKDFHAVTTKSKQLLLARIAEEQCPLADYLRIVRGPYTVRDLIRMTSQTKFIDRIAVTTIRDSFPHYEKSQKVNAITRLRLGLHLVQTLGPIIGTEISTTICTIFMGWEALWLIRYATIHVCAHLRRSLKTQAVLRPAVSLDDFESLNTSAVEELLLRRSVQVIEVLSCPVDNIRASLLQLRSLSFETKASQSAYCFPWIKTLHECFGDISAATGPHLPYLPSDLRGLSFAQISTNTLLSALVLAPDTAPFLEENDSLRVRTLQTMGQHLCISAKARQEGQPVTALDPVFDLTFQFAKSADWNGIIESLVLNPPENVLDVLSKEDKIIENAVKGLREFVVFEKSYEMQNLAAIVRARKTPGVCTYLWTMDLFDQVKRMQASFKERENKDDTGTDAVEG